MSTTKTTVIGTAQLKYDTNGELWAASFSPSIEISHQEIKEQLGDCSGKTKEQVLECAKLLLGAFFSKVSNIELRDAETTEIEADVVRSKEHDNGVISDISIEFIYKEN